MTPRISPILLLLATLAAGETQAQTGTVGGIVSVERGHPAGAVVFLVAAGEGIPHHPVEQPVVIDQVNLRFIPQVVAVLPGETVDFPNSDPVLHNVFSPRGPGDGFNLGTYPPNETRSRRFTEPGVHVILCHVHPEMLAYVMVVPTVYHAIADAGGSFAIEDVPEGRYTLRVWHGRRPTLEREVTVAAGATARVDLHLGR
jgi:plastocyanin